MRQTEALSLRIKDIDLSQHQITIRNAKGMKDRITMLPDSLIPDLKAHLDRTKLFHQQDLLGHKDVKTTMIYTHVLNRGGRGVISPLDA